MKKFFDYTNYQEEINQCLKESGTMKIVDTSLSCRDSSGNRVDDLNNVYYISEGEEEFRKYNATISNNWKKYDDKLISPYGDGLVIQFYNNNPYGLKWLWRTDGTIFVAFGHITTPGRNGKYQTSPYSKNEIKENPYVIAYKSFGNSTFIDEIRYASYWINADIGGVACTTTGEYKICLRGPAEKNMDFKEWLISITNRQAVILTEDSKLIISIAVSGGMVRPFYVKWDKLTNRMQKIFRSNSTNFI